LYYVRTKFLKNRSAGSKVEGGGDIDTHNVAISYYIFPIYAVKEAERESAVGWYIVYRLHQTL
jgi:hypothetical protein